MSAIQAITEGLSSLGYRSEAIIPDYSFSDVWSPHVENRVVALAAFTQTPPSYRSAAIAVLDGSDDNQREIVASNKALCAPLAFVISGDNVSIWEVKQEGSPKLKQTVSVKAIPELFLDNKDSWNPDAIHRAKSIGAFNKTYQLDFVDLGLLPAVEGEIHVKLDKLLNEALLAAEKSYDLSNTVQAQQLFRVLFRLLAAKVLNDRGHPYSKNWDNDDLTSVLRKIEEYYSLDAVLMRPNSESYHAFEAAWNVILSGISFSNISSEDLAFVYENTLVTPKTRKQFGTHSTPRQVAEYIVSRLDLHKYSPEKIQIYEPFAGAGVFLVSALRHLRDLLPVEWSDEYRHEFLLKHLSADELDAFACEVAQLSMILADYPNHNGWQISRHDLFDGNVLFDRMDEHNIVLCNPPFENFTIEERAKYPISKSNVSKAYVALDMALASFPNAIGFVLPRPFIQGRQFKSLRKKVEEQFCEIELVTLPDRIFQVAKVESSLLIAHSPRTDDQTETNITATEVYDDGRLDFLKTGAVSTQRYTSRHYSDELGGNLWIPELHRVWKYLDKNPKLGEQYNVHRGIEWHISQHEAWDHSQKRGYQQGLHTSKGLTQFGHVDTTWLNTNDDVLRGNAMRHAWDKPKLIMNAARLSRGPWRLAARFDIDGLVCSQQFFGIWPKVGQSDEELLIMSAILNSPIANAYIFVHSPEKRIRVSAVKNIPLPRWYPNEAIDLILKYKNALRPDQVFNYSEDDLNEILTQIDAAILAAYDLPASIEQKLLDKFTDAKRPTIHNWEHWYIANPGHGQTLKERIGGNFKPWGRWVSGTFKPLPKEEVHLLRDFGV